MHTLSEAHLTQFIDNLLFLFFVFGVLFFRRRSQQSDKNRILIVSEKRNKTQKKKTERQREDKRSGLISVVCLIDKDVRQRQKGVQKPGEIKLYKLPFNVLG